MRIHTDLSHDDIYQAGREAGVSFLRLGEHGSRSHAGAYEVSLSGSSPRRTANNEDYGATWDEWGIFLSRIFSLSPESVCKGQQGTYENSEHFHWVTGGRFLSPVPPDHKCHKWSVSGRSAGGSYWVHECPCGAIFRRLDGKQSFRDWQVSV